MSDEHLPLQFRKRSVSLAHVEPNDQQDDDAHIPEPGDDYKAFIVGRNNRTEQTLHVALPDGAIMSFRYSHLDSPGEFGESGEWFKLRFLGMKPVELVVHGRNLRRGYDQLFSDRVHCIMVAPSKFDPDDGKPYVRHVAIVPVDVDEAGAAADSRSGRPD